MGKKVTTFQSPKDKRVTEAIQDQLQKSGLHGMAVGAKTICSMVLKKINAANEESTKEELLVIIEELRKFCNTALGEEKASN